MTRTFALCVALAGAAAVPAAASAQLPAPGPLVPPQFQSPPERVPAPPVGKYPEHWAECVDDTNPVPPVLPAGIDPRGVAPGSPNPLLGLSWFVDRMEPAYMDWARFKRSGQERNAETIWKLARQPRFRWFGKFTRPNLKKKVRGFLDRVQCDQPGTVPQMAVMRHQGRDCGGHYRAGGEAEDRATMRWYDEFADAVGDRRVVIGFEPDSLGTIDCLARDRRQDRLDVLRYGVERLSRLPNATIYLEAGAADWEPAHRTAKQLRYIGIAKVRGFMLNVTHHDWTKANIQHGLDISRRVGGKPFIINTSYNGRGPVRGMWCHPPRRGAGIPPTTATHHPLVDAYMWIGRPGYSAGACNGGPLPVGSWWPERALMYAQYQTAWLGRPHGTMQGFYRR